MASREAARASFLDAWTSMASLFSFSPSTARVCGLLLTSGEPLAPAEIAERLAISRGNVSMCLRELRGWGVVRRVPRPGDRSEYYESRGDLFQQTLAIARERKRREFDPVIGSALAALEALAATAPKAEAEKLASVSQYLGIVDRIGREVLDDATATLTLIGLLKATYGRPAGRRKR
jgi:DNA-binding transcriptional regulator GbsR (MarR family)